MIRKINFMSKTKQHNKAKTSHGNPWEGMPSKREKKKEEDLHLDERVFDMETGGLTQETLTKSKKEIDSAVMAEMDRLTREMNKGNPVKGSVSHSSTSQYGYTTQGYSTPKRKGNFTGISRQGQGNRVDFEDYLMGATVKFKGYMTPSEIREVLDMFDVPKKEFDEEITKFKPIPREELFLFKISDIITSLNRLLTDDDSFIEW